MEDYSKIEAYLNNELSIDERQAFEAQLVADEDLRNELNIYKDMVGGVRTAGLKADLERLRAEHQSSSETTSARVFSLTSIRTLAIAASVAVLVGFFLFNSGGGSDPFSSVYYKDAGLPTAMGEENSELLRAMVDYKNEAYDSAIPILNSICEVGEDQRACYFLAQCHLNIENFEIAKSTFLSVIESEIELKYMEASEWYLTYTLYRLGDEAYEQRLEDIKSNPSHRFYDEAKQVND